MMERRIHPSGYVFPHRRVAVLLFPAATLIFVLASRLGATMEEPAMIAVLLTGVVCLGVPHGSLDPLVARKLYGADTRFTMAAFLGLYALVAALCAAGWIAAPNFALSIFLVISALHFGSDWQGRGNFLGRTAYGACVVTVPTVRHAETVRQIYLSLGATDALRIVSVSRLAAWVVALVAVLSLLTRLRHRLRDCLELLAILIGGVMLSPLVFFFCYFCLLHSPRHLAETSREVGLRGLGAIVKAAAPTVAATLVLAAFLWKFLPATRLNDHVVNIIFIGLAALTVPHMLLTEMKERDQQLIGPLATLNR